MSLRAFNQLCLNEVDVVLVMNSAGQLHFCSILFVFVNATRFLLLSLLFFWFFLKLCLQPAWVGLRFFVSKYSFRSRINEWSCRRKDWAYIVHSCPSSLKQVPDVRRADVFALGSCGGCLLWTCVTVVCLDPFCKTPPSCGPPIEKSAVRQNTWAWCVKV